MLRDGDGELQLVNEGRPPSRPPMSRSYREELAHRLAAAALLDLDTARRHVVQVGIDPLQPRRVHRPRTEDGYIGPRNTY